MSEYTDLRISLNLCNFFHDYRQLSRIFINENIKNIEDLQNSIKETFSITKPFYLKCLHYYLPPEQDIRVLQYDDSIDVIPISDPEENIQIIPKKRKRKRSIERFDDTYNENVKSKKKTKKKEEKSIENTPHSEQKKRKRKKSISDEHEFENNIENTVHSTGIKKRDKNTITVLREESVPKNISITTVTGKTLQINEMVDFTVVKSKKSIFNTDCKLKDVKEKGTFVSSANTLIPDKSNRSELNKSVGVNSNMNGLNKSDTRNLNLSVTKMGSWDNNSISMFQEKNIKNCRNNNISVENVSALNKSGVKETNMSNSAHREWYKNSFLTPTQPNKNSESNGEIMNSLTQDNTQNLEISNTKLGSWDNTTFKTPESVWKFKKGSLSNTKNLQLSTTKISSWDDSSFLTKGLNIESKLDNNIVNCSLSSENGKNSKINAEKSISVTSENDQNLNDIKEKNSAYRNSLSDVITRISQENRNNFLDLPLGENITKRRSRVRKRHRKSKVNPETPEIQPENKVYIPPKTIAAPRIHKKFSEEDSSDTVNSPDLSKLNDSVLLHSSPYILHTKHLPEMSVISEEYKNETLEKMFKESNKLLSEPPNVNEKIIFKKLKLDDDYTPVESGLILATISYISDDKECLELQIIAGHQELKDPIGKFSLLLVENEEIEEDENDTSVAYVEWKELINPKLIQ